MQPARTTPGGLHASQRQVTDVIRELMAELRPGGRATEIQPSSHLERDLGIYSLERLELVLRLEQVCGIDLGQDPLRASTVSDLAHLVTGQELPAGENPSAPPSVECPADPSGSRAFTAYAGLWLLLIGGVVWPLMRMTSNGRPAARLLRRGARTLFRAAGCRIEMTGTDHLREALPAVLVANHESYVDALALLAALPVESNFVVNERTVGSSLVGPIVRAARFLTVDRTSIPGRLRCAREMTAALAAGESLLVFPEATFDAGPALLPFRLGAFSSAVAAGRPVIPVTLRGTRQMLPAGARLLRPGPLAVTIHAPIFPRDAGWREALRLRDEARRQLEQAAGPS